MNAAVSEERRVYEEAKHEVELLVVTGETLGDVGELMDTRVLKQGLDLAKVATSVRLGLKLTVGEAMAIVASSMAIEKPFRLVELVERSLV